MAAQFRLCDTLSYDTIRHSPDGRAPCDVSLGHDPAMGQRLIRAQAAMAATGLRGEGPAARRGCAGQARA